MLATEEQRRIGGRIGTLSRHHPDHPELPALRERLAQLRVRQIYAWAVTSLRELPPAAEVARVAAEARRLDNAMNRAGREGDADAT
jgi:hypothetical protein